MTLKQTIDADLKTAMKAREELVRDTLRMVKSELMNREVELGRDLDEGEEIAVLSRAVKTRRDSIAEYEAGGRGDAADKERAEIAIIERYLPKPLDEAALREAIVALAAEVGATSKRDMGKVMKALGERYKGRYDGKVASRLIGELLP
jgi:uncharacterized protein YqeY